MRLLNSGAFFFLLVGIAVLIILLILVFVFRKRMKPAILTEAKASTKIEVMKIIAPTKQHQGSCLLLARRHHSIVLNPSNVSTCIQGLWSSSVAVFEKLAILTFRH